MSTNEAKITQNAERRTQNAERRTRSVYLDFVKGITIFLVVFGHCIQCGNGKGFNYLGDIVFKIIYSFHMPLFALVSGYLFFWSVSSRSPREVFIRQVNNLILPAVSWTILYQTAMESLHIYRGDFSGITDMLMKICRGIYGLWFLWAMLFASVIVIFVRAKLKDSMKVYALIAAVLVFMPVPSLYVFVYPYFAAGYIWHRDGFAEKFSLNLNKILSIGIILAWCIMLLFYDMDSYVYTTGTAVIKYRQGGVFVPEQIWIDIFRWLIGFAGCGAVLILLKLIKPVKFIAAIGMRSLGIYIISGYMLQYMSWHYFQYLPAQGYVVNLMQGVVITAVCYVLSEGISRVKILNRIFFGGR